MRGRGLTYFWAEYQNPNLTSETLAVLMIFKTKAFWNIKWKRSKCKQPLSTEGTKSKSKVPSQGEQGLHTNGQ